MYAVRFSNNIRGPLKRSLPLVLCLVVAGNPCDPQSHASRSLVLLVGSTTPDWSAQEGSDKTRLEVGLLKHQLISKGNQFWEKRGPLQGEIGRYVVKATRIPQG